MKPPTGERFDAALDLFHDHHWTANKPQLGEDQFAELLAVMADWFREEFAPKRSRVTTRKPAKVDKGSEARGRRLVAERSEGLCEVQTVACAGRAREWQHRKNRSQRGTWGAENGLHACSRCHQMIHENPHWARSYGWTVWSHEDPAEVPVLRRGDWVYLDADGGLSVADQVYAGGWSAVEGETQT